MESRKRSKVGYLIANMGWMTISNFASKILVFLMVPFYTRVLTQAGYGFYDLGYTAVTLCVPLLTLNVGESIMRFAIVEKDKIPEYFSTALLVSLVLVFFACIATVICPIAVPLTSPFGEALEGSFILAAAYVLYVLFSQFARGVDQVKTMAFGGLINAAFLMIFSYVFVLGMGFRVFGCYLGAAFAFVVAAAFIAIRCKFWIYLSKPSWRSIRTLAVYGMPLSINSLGWWINSSLGRYAVAVFCGVSPAGMLAAAYKIPSIPKAIQQVFVQAWQISSIKEYDENDTDGFFGRTYDVVCCLSTILISGILLLLPAIATVMFSTEFFDAWIYVPLLLVGLLFDCLSSVIGSVFSARGDTRPIATSAVVSVLVAVGVCIASVPIIGNWGAAFSSMFSSLIIWAMRLRFSRRYIRMKTNRSILIKCLAILSIQTALAIILPLSITWAIVQTLCFALIIVACKSALQYLTILKKVVTTIAKRKS